MSATTKRFYGFSRVQNVDDAGSSLWFELPKTTNADVKRLFGTGLADEDNMKYSQKIAIKSADTGSTVFLYKCFGEWRIGAHDAARTAEMKRLLLQMFE